MIFVTVGTNEARFDRLLRMVDELELDEKLVVQHGHSLHRPAKGDLHDFLSFDEMQRNAEAARVVITHAGVGSIMVALGAGKRPVVVARRKHLGEAVDDHQVDFGQRFAGTGLVTMVESTEELAAALRRESSFVKAAPTASNALALELREFIRERVGGEPVPARP